MKTLVESDRRDLPGIVVVGGSGMLGRRVFEVCSGLVGSRLQAVWRPPSEGWDIRFEEDCDEIAGRFGRQTIVINCAAYTAVDDAEQEPRAALELNSYAPGLLAATCHDASARLMHVSTDFVLPSSSKPQDEDVVEDPAGVYAASKLCGEGRVLSQTDNATVVRLASLYDSEYGRNFGSRMLQQLRDGTVQYRADRARVTCPTPAIVAAEALVELALSDHRFSLLHFACSPTTWLEWSLEAARLLEYGGVIESCDGLECGYEAPRPSVWLDTSRWIGLGLPPPPSWQQALVRTVREKVLGMEQAR